MISSLIKITRNIQKSPQVLFSNTDNGPFGAGRRLLGVMALLCAMATAAVANAPETDVAASPLLSISLPASPAREAGGLPVLTFDGQKVTAQEVSALSAYQLMRALQALLGTDFKLTEVESVELQLKQRLTHWLESFQESQVAAHHDPYDPALVRWDPRYIQKKNSKNETYVPLDRRDILPQDVPSLSPLELQQALRILTEREVSLDDVLINREEYKKQLSILSAHAAREKFQKWTGLDLPLDAFTAGHFKTVE